MQLDLFSILLLGLTGFIAGGINTVAGGGSNLTLPALMMFGLPADIANGTNRLSVLMQCIVGVAGYNKHKMLDRPAAIPILIPCILGGAFGALLAAILPNLFLKPVLLLTILCMSVVILIRPETIAPMPGTTELSPNQNKKLGGACSRLEFTAALFKPVLVLYYSLLLLGDSDIIYSGPTL